MFVAVLALIVGLIVLVWSADRFVEGAAATARYFGMPSLLIGMVVLGFGTSAPEMVVSAFAAVDGSPGIALGNAYGSNIANIALILGITAIIYPITVRSSILKTELPLLAGVTLVSLVLVSDLYISGLDAVILLLLFAGFIGWSIREGLKPNTDPFTQAVEDLTIKTLSLKKAVKWLVVGLFMLVISSRILVWGAVEVAQMMGVSDIIIGLTIIAIGTSLPEMAASVIAARKGENDIAFGNAIGSNLFNTLAVVGIAGAIHPFQVEPETLYRDMVVMTGLTLSLFVLGYGFKGRQGRINRIEGAVLLTVYIGYTFFLMTTLMAS